MQMTTKMTLIKFIRFPTYFSLTCEDDILIISNVKTCIRNPWIIKDDFNLSDLIDEILICTLILKINLHIP